MSSGRRNAKWLGLAAVVFFTLKGLVWAAVAGAGAAGVAVGW